MVHPYNFDPTQPPRRLYKRPCPKCGLPMLLSRIEPTDKIDYDQQTYECPTCAYAETVTDEFR
jgi:endogenous inhibitor of DNA gyrase (YacG/DUF329 family)